VGGCPTGAVFFVWRFVGGRALVRCAFAAHPHPPNYRDKRVALQRRNTLLTLSQEAGAAARQSVASCHLIVVCLDRSRAYERPALRRTAFFSGLPPALCSSARGASRRHHSELGLQCPTSSADGAYLLRAAVPALGGDAVPEPFRLLVTACDAGLMMRGIDPGCRAGPRCVFRPPPLGRASRLRRALRAAPQCASARRSSPVRSFLGALPLAARELVIDELVSGRGSRARATSMSSAAWVLITITPCRIAALSGASAR